MRFLVLMALAHLAASCGSNEASIDPRSPRFLYKGSNGIPPAYRNAELQHVLNEFMDDALAHGRDPWPEEKKLRVIDFQPDLVKGNMPPVKGTDAEGTAPIGICVTAKEVNPSNDKTIFAHHFGYLDANLAEIVGTPYFKAVAYHEFFHCLFGGKHTAPPDFKDIKSPLERLKEQMKADASVDGTSHKLTQDERNARLKDAEHEYFDDISERYGIMAPQLIFDQNFWGYEWDDLVTKLFTETNQ